MSTGISMQMINELRKRTGVGIAKCKEALAATSGDIDEAINHLRKSGLATAAKKSGREAKEGKIDFVETDDCIAILEVSAETDFVANNERFLELLRNVTEEVAKTKPSSLEEFMSQKFSKDPSMTIDEYRATVVQAIGENIQIKRFEIIPKESNKTVGIYSHMGGKILTAVEVKGGNDVDAIAKDIAMHAAAAAPDFLSPEKVPSNVVEQEKEIARSQLAGKPEHIMDKILDGKINAFFDDVCLLRQKFVKDDSVTIQEHINAYAKKKGKDLTVSNFIRWSVGEN